MAGLNAVMSEIQQSEVENDFGWGESIQYTPRSGGPAVTVNAFCTPGNFREYDAKPVVESVVFDEMSFLSVFLDTEPEEGATITYNSQTWLVKDFEGVGPYDILAQSNKRHAGRRSGRRER